MKKLIGLLAVAFVVNTAHVFASETPCKVGEKGPGGGYIFVCLSEQASNLTGMKGLEAAEKDLPGGSNYTWKMAMDGCKDLRDGGFSNWVLPNKEALNLMYERLYLNGNKGKFTDLYYWSSSENGGLGAWLQYFKYGYQGYYLKVSDPKGYNASNDARCVRAF